MNKKSYEWPKNWDRPFSKGNKGAISSNNYYATKTGLEILKKGGNAFDAAIAISLVLSVVEPHHSGIGGGGFSLIYSKNEDKLYAIDARGIAPQKATKDMFIKNNAVYNEWKDNSGKSVTVPSLIKLLSYIYNNFATLDIKELIKPAYEYAEFGFKTSFTQSITVKDESVKRKIELSKEFRSLFLKGYNNGYEFGEVQQNKRIAKLLKILSEKGFDEFYKGDVAEKIVESINAREGCFTKEDLSNYNIKLRDVVETDYKGYSIKTFGLPSSGSTIVEMLNILNNFDLKSMGHNSSESIHIISETMKLGFADRSTLMADPDFFKTDVQKLINPEYAKKLAKIITDYSQDFSKNLGNNYIEDYPGNTSHFSVIDQYGNCVSQTQTIRDWYGSGIVVKDYGFTLNNNMSDFSADIGEKTSQGLEYGEANAIEPFKTPISSMSPVIVFKDKKPYLIIGAAGGPRIITGILQGIVNAIEYDMNPEQLVSFPFIACLTKEQGLELEYGISKDTIERLKERGHVIKPIAVKNMMSSMLNSVMYKDNIFYSASTKRVDGSGGCLCENGSIIYEGISHNQT
ncbi:gamma-glutamyltransferase [Peptoniphilus sp. AGMB00490]|uniref:Glutathione hydrolase proenzyme n=1 Tax=Peptoniphilus faecalis TaxID=2731255 RepID=A0A848RNB0_9FIRM|nr:gamma-glutamyltransferase [Peptoniphilus faecalis]NMW85772.1 gamma-glutamyltransferase [Peptoniphilus faecalis]